MTVGQYKAATPIIQELDKVEAKISALNRIRGNSSSVELSYASEIVQLDSYEFSTLKVNEVVMDILVNRKESLLVKLESI